MKNLLHSIAILMAGSLALMGQSSQLGNTVVKLPQATVTFTVSNAYSGGYQGDVTIKNTSSQTLTNWVLSLSMPGQIGNIWNASVISHTSTNFSINAAAYNWQSSIPPGGSASFGFMGAPSSLIAPPTNFILTTSGSSPTPTPVPTPTATPKPTATPTPIPVATPTPVPTATPTPKPSATPTPVPTPTPTPVATPTPVPTATPTPKPSATPTPVPTPTPTPVATPTATPSPTPGSTTVTTAFPQAKVIFSVTSDWGNGFNGQVVITNTSSQTLSNWSLSLKMAPAITTIWSADIASQSGSTYTIDATSVPWNNTIAPGSSVTFGFTASASLNGVAPTGFTFTAQSGSSPSPTPTPVATPTPAPTPAPSPTATPSPTPKPSPVSPTGYLSTKGNQIVDANGNNVVIRGVNWFGFETGNEVAHGLWQRDYHSFLDQVVSLGFNTLRIPFSQQMLAPGAATTSINFAANPDLQGLTPLQCLDKIINYAGSIGLKVYLDCHSAKADGYAGQNLWYLPGDSYYTEAQWISDWVKLATHYAGNSTVIGCDLKNEPKGNATWGNSSPSTDWNKAAERCGNAILAVNPHLLIIVEGIQTYNGGSYWDGGNLAGAGTYPVTLNVPNQVVYSPHDYPSTVYNQTWFSAPNYPSNLPPVWNTYWGYIFQNQQAPVLVGEFGSLLRTTSDQIWMRSLLAYMDGDYMLSGMSELAVGQKGVSWTFWCLNPDSGDTGGILQNDWQTPDPVKMSYLQSHLAPLIGTGGN